MIDILELHKNIFLVACFLVLFIILNACNNEFSDEEKQEIQTALSDSLLATTQTWGVDMEIIENGTKKVHLTGSYAATFNTDAVNETRIKGPVYIEVFDTTGREKTWVNANRAIYRPGNSEFELFGDVKVRTRTNRTLNSEYLLWNQSKNSIATPQFVVITTAADSIAGTGFTGTTDLSSYTIQEPSGRVVLD